jgi:hypothetical protein
MAWRSRKCANRAIQYRCQSERYGDLWIELAKTGDEGRLKAIVQASKPGDEVGPALALRSLNIDEAVAAIRAAQNANVGKPNLDILSAWNGACTPATQQWFQEIMRARAGGEIAYLTTLHAISRTHGCEFPVDQVFAAPSDHIRDAVYALRLTNKDGEDQLRSISDAALLEQPDGAKSEKFSVLAAWWRHSKNGPCPPWFKTGTAEEADALLQSAFPLRSCE